MTNGIDKVDEKKLVEVKGYKKASSNLLKKVALVVGSVVVTIALMCSLRSCQANKNVEVPEEDQKPAVTDTVTPSKKPSGSTPSNQKPSNGDEQKPEQKPEEKPSEKPEEKPSGSTPDKWDTETLPKDETVTVDWVEQLDDKEPDEDLTRAEKAYIQEYVDYYGISWEDAKASYFAFGPLVLSTDSQDYVEIPKVEYGTRYVFDADDLATINALVADLGMTRAEAEKHYVEVVAPAIGKPIAIEQYVLSK